MKRRRHDEPAGRAGTDRTNRVICPMLARLADLATSHRDPFVASNSARRGHSPKELRWSQKGVEAYLAFLMESRVWGELRPFPWRASEARYPRNRDVEH